MKPLVASAAFLISIATLHAKEPPPRDALAGIDAVIERALQTYQVPGASVAVMVGDEVVHVKGYGFRDVEKKLPVTPETQMPIASITKQFTVAALGTLVRQGKLDWDKPVREYLPDFRLHNEYATSHATPRDLVTHRIGLPRHDAVWYGSDLSREQICRRLQHFPFSRDIRKRFQYNNLMYPDVRLSRRPAREEELGGTGEERDLHPARHEALELHRGRDARRAESFRSPTN